MDVTVRRPDIDTINLPGHLPERAFLRGPGFGTPARIVSP